MNITALVIVAILSLVFVSLLIIKNKKDRKVLEEKINNDYRKPRDEEGDIEIDEVMN